MADIYQNTDRMWFGTREKMGWIETPQSGANVSSSGMTAEVDLLSGGAYVRNSIDSHKNFSFSWGDSADTTLASALRAYANGTYGRGLIYFQDPMYFETNVLPQRWADPSMAVDFEAPDLTGGRFRPSSAVTAPNSHGLPVRSAFYSFPVNANLDGVRDGDALFIPVPDGMELVVGAYYTATGSARVKVRADGSASKITELPQTPVGDPTDMLTVIRDAAYVELYLSTAVSGVASTLQIAGITARLRPVGSGSLAEGTVATNLFTNPNLLPDTTPRELARNLFPNPNLVGDGTMVEVRRNGVTNPILAVDNTGWAQIGTSLGVPVLTTGSGAYSTSGLVVTLTGNMGIGGEGVQVGVNAAMGEVVSLAGVEFWPSMHVKSTKASRFSLRVAFYDASGGVVSVSNISDAETVVPAGVHTRVTVGTALVPPATSVRALIRGILTSGVGYQVLGSGEVLTFSCASTMRGDFFAPGLPSPDPDLTPSWTGAENASASILSGERTRGVTSMAIYNCVAIVSTKFAAPGEKSMRLIATSTSRDSFVQIAVPPGIKTFIATANLEGAQTDTSSKRGYLGGGSPWTAIAPCPNEAGSYPRMHLNSSPGASVEQMGHGGSIGSGDVYWTRPGLFAGNYEGDWFAGNSATGDTDVTHAWASTPNNSASIRSVKPVRALTGGYSSDKYPGRALALRVPAGQAATLPVAAPSTVLARAANAGQVLLGDTAVEVRRNYFPDPKLTNLANYAPTASTFILNSDGTGTLEVTSSATSNVLVTPSAPFTAWGTGQYIAVSFKVQNIGSVPLNLRVAIWDGTEYFYGPAVDVAIGATVVVAGGNIQAKSTSAYMQPRLHTVTTLSAGAKMKISEPIAEKSPTLNPYFDGNSLPTVNGIPKWAGTPNASASIMYGANVAESVAPGQPLKVQALTTAAMLPGEWAEAGVVAGDYGDGPWFAGSTPSATWTGASDNSTSTYLLPIAGELGSGDWFTGEGNSGCKFVGKPTLFNNNGVGGGQVSLACELRETGSWA
jgi:hypothetical protein